MKKLLIILLTFTAFTSSAQVYQRDPAYGRSIDRYEVLKDLGIPTFCGTPGINSTASNRAKIAYDSCGHKFYVFDPTDSTWNQITGAGITALSNSRTGDLITVSGDNGDNTTFNVNNADSLTRVHIGDSNTVFTTPSKVQKDSITLQNNINEKAGIIDTLNQNRLPYWKKWVIFGDSFSATPSRYYGRVDTLLNLTGTVTNAVSGNRFYQQSAILDSILAANPSYFSSFNICSILLGVNDFAASDSLGTINDSSNRTTCAGYLKHMIESILAANPNIELYVMTPTEANGAGVFYHATNSAGWTLTDLEVLISTICARYGVQCIDLHSLANFNLQTIPYLTSDGLHPNYKGSIVLGNIISQAFAGHNNKGAIANGSLQSATSNGNSTADSIRIGSKGTPVSTLELNTYKPVITFNNSSNSTKYGVQFGVDGFIKQINNIAELQLNVGRNTTWGGNMTFYTDSVMRMKITDAAINLYNPLSGISLSLSGPATLPTITGPTSITGTLSLNSVVNNSSSALINQTYTGPSQTYIKWSNGGGQFYIGQESSIAGSFFTGSSAYANVLYSANPIQFLIGGKKLEITSSGVNLSYAANNTGDFVTRNSSTALLNVRTPAQVLTDIGAAAVTNALGLTANTNPTSILSATDINTITGANATWITSPTNPPFLWGNGTLLNLRRSDGYGYQLYGALGNDELAFRSVDNTGTGTWYQAESRSHVAATYTPLTNTVNGKALSTNPVIGFPDIAAGAIANNTIAITQSLSDSSGKLQTTAGSRQLNATIQTQLKAKADTGSVKFITSRGIKSDTTSNQGYITLSIDSAYVVDSIMGGNSGISSSGTYTPTITGIANYAAGTASVCQYSKVGNTVTVWGKVTVQPTATATITTFSLSLPTAATTTFTNSYQAAGTGGGIFSSVYYPYVISSASSGSVLNVSFISNQTSGQQDCQFHVTYQIQ